MVRADSDGTAQTARSEGREVPAESYFRAVLFQRSQRQHLHVNQLSLRADVPNHSLDAHIGGFEPGKLNSRVQVYGRTAQHGAIWISGGWIGSRADFVIHDRHFRPFPGEIAAPIAMGAGFSKPI